MRLKIVTKLALLLTLCPVPCMYAQANQNTTAAPRLGAAYIDGSIILPTNQPLERFEILLLPKGGEQTVAYTYTDLSGRYHFTNISPSTYDIVVRIDGYDESRVTVSLSANRGTIANIMLSPKSVTFTESSSPWDSSVVNIAELNRKFPSRVVDDFQKASESRKKGDNAKAAELLEGVVKTSPDFYPAHNLLGIVYQNMNRFRDAEKQYNILRDVNSKDMVPLVNLATLYLQEAEANASEGPYVTGVMYDDAFHILQEAAHLDPENATVLYLIGVTFYRSKSLPIAEASFLQALSLDTHLSSARIALGNLYIQEQKWKEALDQFDRYLAENPKAADKTQVEAIRARLIQQL
jgi:Flp pilus assembly protein TadD